MVITCPISFEYLLIDKFLVTPFAFSEEFAVHEDRLQGNVLSFEKGLDALSLA
jgi:hypothetical protein